MRTPWLCSFAAVPCPLCSPSYAVSIQRASCDHLEKGSTLHSSLLPGGGGSLSPLALIQLLCVTQWRGAFGLTLRYHDFKVVVDFQPAVRQADRHVWSPPQLVHLLSHLPCCDSNIPRQVYYPGAQPTSQYFAEGGHVWFLLEANN